MNINGGISRIPSKAQQDRANARRRAARLRLESDELLAHLATGSDKLAKAAQREIERRAL